MHWAVQPTMTWAKNWLISKSQRHDSGTYQSEENLHGRQEQEADTSPALVNGNFDGDFSESSPQHCLDQDECECDQPSVLQVRWSLLWKREAGFGVVLDLNNTRSALLGWPLLGLIIIASRPDQLHELVLDELGPLYEIVDIVVPDHQQRLVCNKRCKLMLASHWELFHCRQDLHSQTVGERDIYGVGRPREEGLDHS